MRAIQNKAFYKVFLKRQTPNIEAIEEHLAAFKKSEDLFLSNYLGNKDLMGGNDINVCDLIASATFEQVHKYIEHLKLTFVVLSCKLSSFSELAWDWKARKMLIFRATKGQLL